MRIFLTSVLGALFGLGLYVSGTTDPGKVLGFLDIFGLWDPSLALVMGGAVLVGFFAFQMVEKKKIPLTGCSVQPSSIRAVDRQMLVGATIFGLGWGLSGVCPGPAVFNLGLLDPQAVLFFVGMLAGIALEGLLPFLGAFDSLRRVEQDP